MTTAWTAEAVRLVEHQHPALVPLITAPGVRPTGGNDRYYWDMWPVQAPDGSIARLGTREMWMALTAADRGDPALRHFEAKIHWLERSGESWIDLGAVLPDFDVPYEREWAGSALLDGDHLTLFFTAAGVADRPAGYQQKLFETSTLVSLEGLPIRWSLPRALISEMSADYLSADAHDGEPGTIKAFRDPAFFRDPADGSDYLAFTASLAGSSSVFNGALGLAKRTGEGWSLLPPLIHADGVNNELERAHIVCHQGRYLAFWVTQRATFSPGLRMAPTGLYGMVADSLRGDYRPLNGSGLVLANPEAEPAQSYSWFVTADLLVSSFIDMWGLGGEMIPATAMTAARHFGGTPAPLLQLIVDGDRCTVTHHPAA